MSTLPRASLLVVALVALLSGLAGCSRADLYAITPGPAPASAGSAGSSANGGAGAAGAAGGNGGGGRGGAGAAGLGGAGASGCVPTTAPPGDSDQTVVVGGKTRSYVLHVPAAYDGTQPAPLVLDFHGIGETGMSERSSSPYPPTLDAEGVIMAFPDGLNGPAGSAWNVGPCCVANVDDVAFARAVVEQIQTLTCVDSSRIYAVGVLTGGGLAHYLGCHAADVFAAVAPAAFDLLAENVEDCIPARPVTVISFRGTGMSRVPYEGGPSSLVPGMPLTFLGAEGTFEEWARIDGCTGPASEPDANGCSAYSDCEQGSEVILCTKQGGTDDPGDPEIAWPVLARHTL